MPRRYVTQAEFGRLVGLTRSGVNYHVRTGHLTCDRADRRLDLHRADRELAEHFQAPRKFKDEMEHHLLLWRTERIRQQTEMLILRRRRLEGKLIPLADHQRELREVRQAFLDEVLDKVRLILNEIYDRNPDDFSPSRVDLILGQELRRRLRIYLNPLH